jgi:hypothetical protein
MWHGHSCGGGVSGVGGYDRNDRKIYNIHVG